MENGDVLTVGLDVYSFCSQPPPVDIKGCRTCERVGCVSSPVFALLVILSLTLEELCEQQDVWKIPARTSTLGFFFEAASPVGKHFICSDALAARTQHFSRARKYV